MPMTNPHHGKKKDSWSLIIQLVCKETHAPTTKKAIANGVPHIAASFQVRFRRYRLPIHDIIAGLSRAREDRVATRRHVTGIHMRARHPYAFEIGAWRSARRDAMLFSHQPETRHDS